MLLSETLYINTCSYVLAPAKVESGSVLTLTALKYAKLKKELISQHLMANTLI